MLRPLPNHGTLRLPNDDDDELGHETVCTVLFGHETVFIVLFGHEVQSNP